MTSSWQALRLAGQEGRALGMEIGARVAEGVVVLPLHRQPPGDGDREHPANR